MDNDLMARRLRPPSQPTPANGQRPDQLPSPWDVPLTGGQFASPEGQSIPQDPPFAPPDGQLGPPDPQAHADVPWDRPDPELWPPVDDEAAVTQLTWSAMGGVPAAYVPDWPAADSPAADDPAPWDRPASNEADQSHDPDDAMAPVVSDVTQAPAAAWASWNGNGQYAPPDVPEQIVAAAHSDGPVDFDESPAAPWGEPVSPPYSGEVSTGANLAGHDPVPDWPAEDDLTVVPPTSRGPVMPEDSWPVTPPVTPPVAPPPAAPEVTSEAAAAPQFAPEAPPTVAPEAPPTVAPEAPPVAAAEVVAAPEFAPESELSMTEPATPADEPEPTTPEPATPSVTAVLMPVGANPQNMVLRIEVAIVDQTHRANPADAAKPVGPDADVRRPAYEPRHREGRASMPEPEYLWDVPPEAPDLPQQRRQRQPAPANAQPPSPVRHVNPPPSAWQPAASVPPQPMTIDWELPAVGGLQRTADPLAPWSTPASGQPPYQQPAHAPSPTWALTQPVASYQPPAPQYQPPAPPAHQPYQPAYPPQEYQPAPPQAFPPQAYQPAPPQPDWPPDQLVGQAHDPLAGLPLAPYVAPAPYAPTAPAVSTPPQMPVQSFQSAPAAGSPARTGQVATDQSDVWFLSNQPAATVVEEDHAQPEGSSSSILTAGLTIGFALLVIVLVLVFIQLMTSLLR